MKRTILAVATSFLCISCTAVIDEASLLPTLKAPEASDVLRPPENYTLSEEIIELGTLGKVHIVRLDNPNTDDVVIINGGSGHFTQRASRGFARIAHMSGSDILTYDYPGRGGTTLAATADTLIAMGPELVAAYRRIGWLKNGQNYVYGFSFGGSNASNMARVGGFNGLILDSTTSDIVALGRDMSPQADELATPAIIQDFATKLRAEGADVTQSSSSGGHGRAIYGDDTLVAIRDFMAKTKK
ncbi:MAG: hypothetical protein FD128_1450 [Hyphomonadaceae bacterium]|nr:MAG: hypothetical protein FD128_1450 [Hyphomonadaceae bacterium]